jgi:hypothetical protein
MPPTRREAIPKKALEIVEASPKGVRYSELMTRVAEALPGIPKNTIAGKALSENN